ncbi:hypothetical protein GE09DRAFT_1211331 [Coniochaeta sp. 2T2.1]|nr:hypothetical protein GE09DRAFT_1211331 [Coniochaeta sp. 2T2.1]
MSSAVAELEASLQAMLGLKPPGVSGSRITGITTLCVNNVQSESVLIQKLYTHFKKAPGTHKLGVLYVVDSVTRKWMEQAKAQGQSVSSAAQDGTFAAGVHRVTELMPVLMNDIISSAPQDQKEKIKKLVDIWEKGQTFPQSLLASFRDKLYAPTTAASTTPPGSPPANGLAFAQGGQPAPAAAAAPPPANMPSIMEALANIARQNATTAQGNPSVPAPVQAQAAPAYSVPGVYNSIAAPVPSVTPQQPGLPYLTNAQPGAAPVNMPQMPQVPQMPYMPYQYPPQQPQQPQAAQAAALANALGMAAPGFPPGQAAPAMPNANIVDPKVQQQLVLIQTLAAQGVPFDKITSILALMGNQPAAPAAVPPPSVPPPQQMPQPTSSYAAPWEAPRHDESRDNRNGYRSPKPRGRSRSRSPARGGWDAPPNRDRGYNNYGHNSPQGGRGGRGGHDDRGRDNYRQRSPARNRGFTPEEEPEPQDKWVEYDNSLPNGSIKVLSRTLFVGGVTCSEAELREIFSRYGKVQTCIVNKDKRHAFVKMYWRKDAMRAKEAMEHNRDHDLPLRTRWGVGFGPRDCSDYQTGISVIPIHKLTDADRKWMLTAPFGGSGGRPIVTGLSVEEPDIEIGAGVSSKAISRRMQTDKSGNQGPRSTKEHDEPQMPSPVQAGRGGPPMGGDRGGRGWRGRGDGGGGGRRDTGRREERMNEDSNHGNHNNNRDRHRGGGPSQADEPVVMGLPLGITLGPNGINFPPGFAFGGGQGGQQGA